MPEDLSPPAGRLRLKMTCPLSPVTDIIADSILIPAVQGARLILPGMAPLFCQLNQGQIIIHRTGHPPMTYLISRGVAEVRRDICAVMAWGMRQDEVNPNKIQSLLTDAETALPTLISALARRELQTRIDFYRHLLAQ